MGSRAEVLAAVAWLGACAATAPPLPAIDSTTGGTTTGITSVGGSTSGATAGVDGSGGPTTTGPATSSGSTGMPATSTTGDPCEACVLDSCAAELEACLADPGCACLLRCADEGGTVEQCVETCGSDSFAALECIADQCGDVCAEGGGSSTGAPPVTGAYAPCAGDVDCPEGMTCFPTFDFCSPNCAGDDTLCPDPPGGDAMPVCSGFNDMCVLRCPEGTTCPEGMQCVLVGGGVTACSY